MVSSKPNILLIMADQLAPQFLPAYGHRVVRTPNIDGICENGVVFDAAYTNFPLCAPARYSMMTGCLPSNIRAWDNAAELSSEIPTFAHYLSGLGYHTCLSGKMHFCGPDQLHGFDQRLTTDVYPADYSWTPDWDAPEKIHDWFHTMDVVKTAGTCVRSNNLDYDDEVTFKAERYLFDRARGDAADPFCLVASYIHPHDPYITRARYWDLYQSQDIDMPGYAAGEVPEDPHSSRLRQGIGISQAELTETQIRSARRAYYGSISYVDDQVGRLMTALKESGFADSTVVLLTADHGDMLGERGLWFKMSWFEHSARVPLVMSFPGQIQAGRSAPAVSLVDILPTLVGLATDGQGREYQAPLDGKSLLPQLSGADGHDYVVGQYLAEMTPEPIFMVRDHCTKFVLSDNDPPLCFDLKNDPDELVNLAAESKGKADAEAVWSEMRARFDVDSMANLILESQRRRHAIAPVQASQGLAWDYEPRTDAAHSYIRNTMELYEIERRSRFPTVD